MAKTIAQRINRFCKKYPEPRQYGFKLRWCLADGKHEQIIGNENIGLRYYYNNLISRSAGKPFYIQHYRYDKETQLLECAYAVIECTVPKENENRRWIYAERYFIPKEEKVLYCQDGSIGPYIIHKSNRNETVREPRKFFQGFHRKDCSYEDFREAFRLATDGDPDLPPRYIRQEYDYYPWIMTEWIVHKRIERKGKGTAQPKIDKMLMRELTDISIIVPKINSYQNVGCRGHYTTNYHVYFDNLGSVFRMFYKIGDNIIETVRAYLDKNGKVVITKKDGENWVPNGGFSEYQFSKDIINLEDLYAFQHLGYMKKLDNLNLYRAI